MDANARLAQYEKEVASLRSDRKLLKRHCKELVEQQSRREEHLSALRSLLLPGSADPPSDEADMAALQTLLDFRDELAQLRGSHAQVVASRDNLQGQLQVKDVALAEATARGAERAKQTEALEGERRKLTGDLMAIQRELQDAKVRASDAEKTILTDAAQIETLREGVQRGQEALAALQENAQVLASDKVRLQNDIESRERDFHQLKERLAQEAERRIGAESSLEEHRQALDELKRKQTNVQIEFQENLTRAARRAEQALEGQLRAEQERRGLEDQLRALEAAVAKTQGLEDRLRGAEAALAKTEGLEDRLGRAEAALAEATASGPLPPPTYDALVGAILKSGGEADQLEAENKREEDRGRQEGTTAEEEVTENGPPTLVVDAVSEGRVRALEEEVSRGREEAVRLQLEVERLGEARRELEVAQEESIALVASLDRDLTASRREKQEMETAVARADEEAQAMARLLAAETSAKKQLEAQITELEDCAESLRSVGKWYEEKWSTEDNKVYYVDHATKTTHWSLPPSSTEEQGPAPSQAVCEVHGVAASGGGDTAVTAANGSASPLPPGPRSEQAPSTVSKTNDQGLSEVLASLALSHMSGALAVAGVRMLRDLVPGPKHPNDEQIMQQAGLNKVQVAKLRKTAAQRLESRPGVEEPLSPVSPGASVVEFTGWRKEVQENPIPPFGIDSPVIQHLLASWTTDPQKLRYVSLWLTVLINEDAEAPIPESFPSGLQLVGLLPEIKDGFLTLIVPMLKERHSQCVVHTRMEGSDRWGLKIKVVPKVQAAESATQASQRGSVSSAGAGGSRTGQSPAPGRSRPRQQQQQQQQKQQKQKQPAGGRSTQPTAKPTRESILERLRAATSSTLSVNASTKGRVPSQSAAAKGINGPSAGTMGAGYQPPGPNAVDLNAGVSLADRISEGLANLDMDDF